MRLLRKSHVGCCQSPHLIWFPFDMHVTMTSCRTSSSESSQIAQVSISYKAELIKNASFCTMFDPEAQHELSHQRTSCALCWKEEEQKLNLICRLSIYLMRKKSLICTYSRIGRKSKTQGHCVVVVLKKLLKEWKLRVILYWIHHEERNELWISDREDLWKEGVEKNSRWWKKLNSADFLQIRIRQATKYYAFKLTMTLMTVPDCVISSHSMSLMLVFACNSSSSIFPFLISSLVFKLDCSSWVRNIFLFLSLFTCVRNEFMLVWSYRHTSSLINKTSSDSLG